MKKWITAIIIITSLFVGYTAGHHSTVHSIVDVDKSSAGFQVYFADGTGHWYEY